MSYIKNSEHEKVMKLSDQVQVMPGQIVSKTLAQNAAVSVTLFAFANWSSVNFLESFKHCCKSVYIFELDHVLSNLT